MKSSPHTSPHLRLTSCWMRRFDVLKREIWSKATTDRMAKNKRDFGPARGTSYQKIKVPRKRIASSPVGRLVSVPRRHRGCMFRGDGLLQNLQFPIPQFAFSTFPSSIRTLPEHSTFSHQKILVERRTPNTMATLHCGLPNPLPVVL